MINKKERKESDMEDCSEAVQVIGSNGKLWWASVRYKECVGFAIHESKHLALLYADIQTFRRHTEHRILVANKKK